jgi:adenine deaminase
MMTDLPDDLILDATDEVVLRQDLVQVALGRRQADRILRVGRMLDVGSGTWADDVEIVIRGRRIAFVGPRGSYTGSAAEGGGAARPCRRAGFWRGPQAHRKLASHART